MKKVKGIDQDKQGVYDRAEAVLNRLGVTKKDMLPSLYSAFQLQTVQLLMDGYQERFIGHKLEELAKARVFDLKN